MVQVPERAVLSPALLALLVMAAGAGLTLLLDPVSLIVLASPAFDELVY